MTIGKKLYLGFGAILAIMLALFIVNIFTVRREYNARATVRDTLANVQTIEAVRLQMMANRLFLGNYLLSGDLRDEDRTNKGVNDLLGTLKDAEGKVTDANLRAALTQVDENERGWSENFAKPIRATPPSPICRFTICSTIPLPGLPNLPPRSTKPIKPFVNRSTIPTPWPRALLPGAPESPRPAPCSPSSWEFLSPSAPPRPSRNLCIT